MGARSAAPESPRRLLILGLDSVPPDLLFDRMRPVMPNMSRLLDRSVLAPLRTTDPPITVPAWAVMFTGMDPGALGLYGLVHRRPGSYFDTYLPTSNLLPFPTLWSLLSERGRRVAVIGMPPGYPPPGVNGLAISGFHTPPGRTDYTHPVGLAAELQARYGPYRFDVTARTEARDRLRGELVSMTRQRFAIAHDLFRREPWDLFALHEIGTDRLHHAYWADFHPQDPRYRPGNPFEKVAEEYYAVLDEGIGRLVDQAGEDTAIAVASDHGSMSYAGCFCINVWLQEQGLLTLPNPVPAGTLLEKAGVDWSRTSVWGAGGYYARIFFNVRGREPHGIVEPADLPMVKAELIGRLAALRDPQGRPLPVRVLEPHARYREVRGDAPDLMVYVDELRWRSAGTVGHPGVFLAENDTGPDQAVHSFDGVFALFDPQRPGGGRRLPTQQIIDVMPTLLSLLGEPVPAHVQGRPMPEVVRG